MLNIKDTEQKLIYNHKQDSHMFKQSHVTRQEFYSSVSNKKLNMHKMPCVNILCIYICIKISRKQLHYVFPYVNSWLTEIVNSTNSQ